MQRYVCVHGHFYQPPRENPWLDIVEVQDSAAPYHDWNERITAECYGPNAAARILGADGVIEDIFNNYARMSFNFGPTLLTWLQREASDVYDAILQADKESQERFNGHGSALAQVYGHVILPLASSQDQRTQVIWGVRDFESRFGRRPEGMWLPETAVNTASLEALAEQGILYTILGPHQARRVRHVNGGWQDVNQAVFDPTQPYSVHLPSGRKISAFFYNGRLSHAVAFEQVLADGAGFARRLAEATGPGDVPQLASIATDGETYGHHHRFGDMALAYALAELDKSKHVELTNYGSYLEMHPPRNEVEIVENSSWSCAHGVERWRSDCGCDTGSHPDWNQQWRAPLRAALAWLSDELAERFAREGASLLEDPWAARDAYIDLVLDRSPESVDAFLGRHAARALNAATPTRALKLLEMQRHGLLMFASCAWFFDDVSGIETVQALLHAGRAVQLAEELSGPGIEVELLRRLEPAKSNLPSQGDAAQVYRRYVMATKVDLRRAAAHYAVASVFNERDEDERIAAYAVDRLEARTAVSGRSRMVMGRIRVTCEVDRESDAFSYAMLHLGDQNLTGGLSVDGAEAFQDFVDKTEPVFAGGDFPAVIRLIDEHFGGEPLSLRSLFREEQRQTLRELLRPVLEEAEASYRHLYEEHISLLRFLAGFDFPLPNRLRLASEIALDLEMGRALRQDDIDAEHIRSILQEAKLAKIQFDGERLALDLENTLERFTSELDRGVRLPHRRGTDVGWGPALSRLEAAVALLPELPFSVGLWRVQNTVFGLWRLLAEKPEAESGLMPRLVEVGRALNLRLAD